MKTKYRDQIELEYRPAISPDNFLGLNSIHSRKKERPLSDTLALFALLAIGIIGSQTISGETRPQILLFPSRTSSKETNRKKAERIT